MKKKLLIVSGVLALAFAPLASAQNIDDLTAGLNAFVDKTPPSLPLAAGAGIDWSTAYIGNLISGDFPFVHLGVGLQAGATTISPDAVNPLLTTFGGSKVDMMAIPFAVANVRLGGLILPFDVGLKVGFLPDALANSVADTSFNYQNIGFDVRYNLVKSDLLLPDVSVGGGISALKMGVDRVLGSATVLSYGSDQIQFSAPKANLSLESVSFDAKVQVSKQLLYFLTPYIGATASFGTGKASSGIAATINPNYDGGGTVNTVSQWSALTGKSITATGVTTSRETGAFGLKLFGGASINLLLVYLDLQGMLSPLDGGIGGSVGLRAQL